jgi:mannosyl-3-phosphoglycerate phosphatase
MVTRQGPFYIAEMIVVFTGLDGTLLDGESYSFSAAAPALHRLKARQIPLILVSSKTFEEVELWRRKLANDDAFVVENGAAVFAPVGSPPLSKNSKRFGNYETAVFGIPYDDLTSSLNSAARESGCRVRGFSEMTAAEISERCGLPYKEAVSAKSRQYDEPFLLLEGDLWTLQRVLQRRGLTLTRGGRFLHVSGQHDKSDAVLFLIQAYRKLGPVRTIGLGDAPNDTGFLNLVDHPVVVQSPVSEEVLKIATRARLASSGPRGWNESLLEILDTIDPAD